MADKLAAVIFGRRSAPPDAVLAFLQPPMGRPSMEILAGPSLLLAVKWCVPDNRKMTGNGVSVSVERP